MKLIAKNIFSFIYDEILFEIFDAFPFHKNFWKFKWPSNPAKLGKIRRASLISKNFYCVCR